MPEMPQSPVNECQSAAAIEPAALIAWPARERIARDGWVLRFSDGYTHRGNSVATFEFSGRDLETAIDRVEREYRARDLPPMFQVAAHVEPAALSEALLARDYEMISPTFVRVTTPAKAIARLPDAGDVTASASANGEFAQLVLTGSRSEGDGRERLDILARISVPVICITAFERGKAVSCGMGVNVDGKVGVNLMRTDAAHRRKSHAQRVLSAIARWAEQQRAGTLYLGVEMANTPAVTLYERAGFEPAYSYRYYAKRRHS
jgi:GNAT superfamily N-acetyltransferase